VVKKYHRLANVLGVRVGHKMANKGKRMKWPGRAGIKRKRHRALNAGGQAVPEGAFRSLMRFHGKYVQQEDDEKTQNDKS